MSDWVKGFLMGWGAAMIGAAIGLSVGGCSEPSSTDQIRQAAQVVAIITDYEVKTMRFESEEDADDYIAGMEEAAEREYDRQKEQAVVDEYDRQDEIKKTAFEWADLDNILIYDPDGWREGAPLGEKSMDEPITQDEYDKRVWISTIGPRTREGRWTS
jgi:hypothetical protein